MTESQRFFYILESPNGNYREDSVEARNKTEARKIIADSYRADTPRRAKASGFIPFSDCRIQWTREDDSRAIRPSGKLDRREAEVDSKKVLPLVHPLHPAIGALMRDGQYVYYINFGKQMEYREGSIEYLMTMVDESEALKAA